LATGLQSHAGHDILRKWIRGTRVICRGAPHAANRFATGRCHRRDRVLRVEVYDPAARLSRAYSDNVLAVGGRRQESIPTAMNDRSGLWRVVVDDILSGTRSEANFVIGESE